MAINWATGAEPRKLAGAAVLIRKPKQYREGRTPEPGCFTTA